MPTDTNQTTNQAASSITSHIEGSFGAPKIIYVLYLVGFVFPLAALGGLVYAYITKAETAEVKSHLDFQLRTFWWGVAALIAGGLLSVILIGWFLILAWIVWTLTRCITGLQLASKGTPISAVGPFGFLAK